MAACGRYGFVSPDAADDPPDATDGPHVAAPVLVGSAKEHIGDSSTLVFPLTVPPGADRFLIVSVAIGSMCGDASVPTVTGITYAGAPLKPVDVITGTPCAANATHSEQWQLVAPAMGTNDVAIALSGPGQTLHGGALIFTGVDQTTPVRASMTGRGANMAATVVVPSAIGDLVVSFVGQGDSINETGTGQTPAFLQNVSSSNTLDNSAASTTPGIVPVTAMDWIFGSSDEWQMIACSLRPPDGASPGTRARVE
jgi:hypothetical protein